MQGTRHRRLTPNVRDPVRLRHQSGRRTRRALRTGPSSHCPPAASLAVFGLVWSFLVMSAPRARSGKDSEPTGPSVDCVYLGRLGAHSSGLPANSNPSSCLVHASTKRATEKKSGRNPCSMASQSPHLSPEFSSVWIRDVPRNWRAAVRKRCQPRLTAKPPLISLTYTPNWPQEEKKGLRRSCKGAVSGNGRLSYRVIPATGVVPYFPAFGRCVHGVVG